jgi:site-specific recombinase XerD
LVKIERCGPQFSMSMFCGVNGSGHGQSPGRDFVAGCADARRDCAHCADTRERRYQTFWWTTYSLGLRLGEALNLRIGDIDAARGHVHIRNGKGHKDRFVVLPTLTLACLRRYWREHRHPELLFPGNGTSSDGCMDRGSTQKAFARVIAHCKIKKKASIHSLRHAYATHLIEIGLNLRGVQELLGHSCPKTTARYVHMTDKCRDDRRVLIDRLITQLRETMLRQRSR